MGGGRLGRIIHTSMVTASGSTWRKADPEPVTSEPTDHWPVVDTMRAMHALPLARLIRPVVLREPTDGHRAATWLELFFDLCFVIAVAAIAASLHDDPTGDGAIRAMAALVPVWWAWMGFTWYATAFDNDDVVYRLAFLAAMLGTIAMAASVIDAVEGHPEGFVLAYVAVRSVLVGLFVRAWRAPASRTVFTQRYVAGNTFGVLLWLASLAVPPATAPALWTAAILVELATPILAVRGITGAGSRTRTFDAGHIRERYGLFTLIVLGESLLSVAVGTAGTEWRVPAVVAGVAGFVAAAAVWWLYFDRVGAAALQLGATAAFYWGYGHLIVYAGIAAAGAGTILAIEASALAIETSAVADEHALDGARLALGGGLAAFLMGIAFIRWATGPAYRDTVLVARLGAAALVALLAIAAPTLGAMGFAVALAASLVGLTALEAVLAPLSADPLAAATGEAIEPD